MTWCVKTCAHEKRAELFFSIVLPRQLSQALLFFKSIEVETKFPFANSISAFSRSQTRTGPQQVVGLNANLIALPCLVLTFELLRSGGIELAARQRGWPRRSAAYVRAQKMGAARGPDRYSLRASLGCYSL
jgi:hypothetical protein